MGAPLAPVRHLREKLRQLILHIYNCDLVLGILAYYITRKQIML